MSLISMGCIVEGHGEVETVPVLLQRIKALYAPHVVLKPPHIIRTPRSLLVKPGELERAVTLAALKTGTQGRILVLIDADEDCPAQLGPQLLARAKAVQSDRVIEVVLAKREFESWFAAAAESLQGQCGMPLDLQSPPDVERVGKKWIQDRLANYAETVDQVKLTRAFDLNLARRSDSFDKCIRAVCRLLDCEAPQRVT